MKKTPTIYLTILIVLMGVIIASLGAREAAAATATVNVTNVNVRSGPGTGYNIVDGLSAETAVEIVQTQDDWSQVRYNGQQGWIKTEYLQIDLELTITGASVNLRSGPGTSYSAITQLPSGERLTLLGVSGEWYKVKDRAGREGYVFSELAAQTASAPPAAQTESAAPAGTEPAPPPVSAGSGNDPSFGTVKADSVVNVRSGPGTGFAPLGQLTPHTDYPLLGDKDDWYRIRFNGDDNAWVAAYLVTKTEPLAPLEPEAAAATGDDAITVLLNGQAMSFAVAPIIENGRTMVPLRAIFEALGATISWDDATRTVTATKDNTVIILPIGSLSPTVNGTVYPLDTAATIVDNHTLAPLRFVGETLGATVGWEADSRTVTINTPEGTPDAAALPSQVTVRDSGTSLRNGPSGNYEKLGAADAGEELTVLAQRDGWYQVSREGEIVWIASWLVDAIYPPAPAPAPESESGSESATPAEEPLSPEAQLESDIPVGSVQKLNTRGDENAPVEAGYLSLASLVNQSGYRLVMKGGTALDPEIEESDDRKKIVFTFEHTKIKGNRDELSFYIGTGKNSRLEIAGQTVDDTTWVTIEMPLAYAYTITEEESDTKVVFTIPPQLLQIQNVRLNNGNQILEVKGTSAMTYNENLNDHTLTVALTDTLPGFAEEHYDYTDKRDLAEQLTVKAAKGGGTLLTIELGDNVAEYIITQNSDGNRISIALISVDQIVGEIVPPPATETDDERVVVWIDAGHGGSETGCISDHTGLKEKDINLPVALKVQELLTSAGVEVRMTRTDDSYVSLNDRAELANAAAADLFVSIHANSVDNYDPNGTQTHYYASADNAALAAQEYERALLAELIQQSMIKYCERNDRGVRGTSESNFLVLRATTMPSVLVEMAFMSNAEEAALLARDDFQTLAARAIAEGIHKYIKIML